MADQRHDRIARLTTDSIDMGTYDMAMPADRDPTYTPDPATCVDQNIVRQVAGPLCRSGVHHSQLDLADVPCAMCVELAEFAVVALAGRLLPADAKREWSVRFADGYVSTVRHTERSARLRAADYGHDNAEPVHRAVGPWLPEESGS
jgi:hypothetical protein